jgi:hypothetical protein
LLIAAAALDLTRCGLVLMTFRHVAPAVGLVAAGIVAAAVSVSAARGWWAGQRWAGWAALLIGFASAPQASASGFRAAYMIPDWATAALGVLLSVAVLANAGQKRSLPASTAGERASAAIGGEPSLGPGSPDPGDAGSPARHRLLLDG